MNELIELAVKSILEDEEVFPEGTQVIIGTSDEVQSLPRAEISSVQVSAVDGFPPSATEKQAQVFLRILASAETTGRAGLQLTVQKITEAIFAGKFKGVDVEIGDADVYFHDATEFQSMIENNENLLQLICGFDLYCNLPTKLTE
jgi:hypothetical protein